MYGGYRKQVYVIAYETKHLQNLKSGNDVLNFVSKKGRSQGHMTP